ncbi:DUF5719 family protein [Streptacidiphilus sp. P02-A3a]|uniref:DUF5719 family protein n=1 Tax=Streptacidiphilus sp. P02-A3a TaxID=2704468 RepID=UPI0015FCAA67|nr:DUF5719 family protein [Streptacidiphilus sp. P02-A3a]QMU67857.1 hypothetical protein GXP74_06045 [Streptacidiphilus sp. P02-A3a]
MISRTTQSLLGAVGVLAIAVGVAEVHPPTSQAAVSGTTVRTAVQNTALVCPAPLQGGGSTVYSLAVPGSSSSTSTTGSAVLSPLAAGSGAGPAASSSAAPSASSSAPASTPQALVQQTSIGGTTSAKGASGDKAPALTGTATGATAPGFTVQQTTTDTDQTLSGTECTAPGTDFWFAGADSNKGSNDTIELTNTEDTASDADIHIFNGAGEVENAQASNLDIPADGSLSLSLSSLLSPFNSNTSLAVHVVVHTGRIAAALHAQSSHGTDWLPATTLGTSQVIPGLPGDVSDATLVVADTGATDAELNIHLASSGGLIVPAGHESIDVKAGTVASVDLGAITHGEPATLELTPASGTGQPPVPVVAGIQVVRGGSGSTDTGYLAGAGPIGQRTTAAGDSAGDSTLLLSTLTTASTVKVTSVGGSGSTPSVQNVSVPAGATVSVTPKAPSGSGPFAVTIEPVSGGPVYAARMISRKSGSNLGFTIQQLSDDHSTVEIPHVVQDGSVLLP